MEFDAANMLVPAAPGGRPPGVDPQSDRPVGTVLDRAPVLVWLTDASGRRTWSSQALLRFTGRSLDQETGWGWAEGLHPEDRGTALADIRRALAAHAAFESRTRLRRADGEYRWMLDRGVPAFDQRGEFSGFVGSCVDITDEQRVRERLRRRERQQAALADFGKQALSTPDLDVLFTAAVELVAGNLGVGFVKILERLPSGDFLLRAGVGWHDGLVGRAVVDGRLGSQAGYTLILNELVIVDDLRSEERFDGPALLFDHGVVSGISVTIGEGDAPFGVLGAHSGEPRRFSDDDLVLLRSVANVLAAAITRAQAEDVVRRSEVEARVALGQARTAEAKAVAAQHVAEESLGQLDMLFENAPLGLGFLSPQLRFIRLNERLAEMIGASAGRIVGRSIAEALPDLGGRLEPHIRRVLDTGEPVVDLEVTGSTGAAPGVQRHWLVDYLPVRTAGGRLLGVGAVVVEITHRWRAERAARLSAAAADLAARGLPLDDLLQQAAHLGLPDFADACRIELVGTDGNAPRNVLAHRDHDPDERRRPEGPAPAWGLSALSTLVLGSRQPRLLDTGGDGTLACLAADSADLEWARRAGVCSAMCLPLTVGDRLFGAVTYYSTTSSGRRYRPGDLPSAQDLCERIAHAVHNARLAEEARRNRARIELLARMGDFPPGVGAHEQLQAVAGIVVPGFADTCILYVLQADGDLRVESVSGLFCSLAGADRPAPPACVGRVLAGDRPVIETLPVGPEATPRTPSPAGPTPIDPTACSVLSVPVRGPGGPVGVMMFGYTGDSDRRYQASDVPMAEELAQRAARYLASARRLEGEQAKAEEFQRSLLPGRLPTLRGLAMAARYIPGTAGLTVGGDWYDAMRLTDGRILLAVGDVAGHGIPAAASMGKLRHTLRFCGHEGPDPRVILERLNRFFYDEGDLEMTTACVAIHDPLTETLDFASAGHLPPLLRFADGATTTLEGGRGLPLGVSDQFGYQQARVTLPPGATLALFTDGLVERRGEHLDSGLDRLAEVVRSGPFDLEHLADHVLAELAPDGAPDDITLLLVQPTCPGRAFQLQLASGPGDDPAPMRSPARWPDETGRSTGEASGNGQQRG